MQPENDLIHTLGGLLINDPEVAPEGWQRIVLVSMVEAGSIDITGFSYVAGGKAIPASPSLNGALDLIAQLHQAMATRTGRAWQACLLRIERTGLALSIEFEYDDPSRWAITPRNVRQRAEEFR
jgi:hypothetical protein